MNNNNRNTFLDCKDAFQELLLKECGMSSAADVANAMPGGNRILSAYEPGAKKKKDFETKEELEEFLKENPDWEQYECIEEGNRRDKLFDFVDREIRTLRDYIDKNVEHKGVAREMKISLDTIADRLIIIQHLK